MKINKTISEGILPIYKPRGVSSFYMIKKLRQITGVKRIGHAGTLDPLASGVLVVGIGREFTRKLDDIVKAEKEYEAMIIMGTISTTDDEEGEKKQIGGEISIKNRPRITVIRKLLDEKFTGIIEQVPPVYSAVHLKGKRAYALARMTGGDEAWSELEMIEKELKPITREVKRIDILDYKWPKLKLRIVTGRGVYIRAIARDLGRMLNMGGYLGSLIRTRVGQYTLKQAINVK